MEQQQQGNQKTQWPELMGKSYEEAEEAIKKDNQILTVHKVLQGAPVTMDYRPDRVRVIVDENGVVVATPVTG